MRKCFNCQKEMPEMTEHYVIDSEVHCTDCTEVYPVSYHYYVNGEYMGDSDQIEHVHEFDDEYENEEEVGEDLQDANH